MTANNQVTYNEAAKRYEMPFGHLVVYANVRKDKNTLYIDYVFAPQELRGKGAAEEFMRKLMDVVRAEELKAMPICGYAASWLGRHSEYQDLISKEGLINSRFHSVSCSWTDHQGKFSG